MSSRGISVFVCLMLAIADVWFHPISGESRQHSISNTASQEKPLQGAAAIQQLKTDGSYTSLAEAMAAVSSNAVIPQQRKLMAADAAMEDEFGNAVALSGNTAVVGAPADDIGANANQGSVHVFVRSGSAWSLQQKLTASDGAAGNRFGCSVAVFGDTVAVGARYANGDRGAVYIFTRNNATWTQQPRLTANDGAANDFFGDAIALSGDTLAVGAHAADISGMADQGAVYVYARQGASWLLQWKLFASDGEAFDEFGASVAVSGDNVLIGAPLHDVEANADQGSAYVFARVGNIWSQQAQLLGRGGATGDSFGCAVAISGDTAAVGAKLNDFNGVNQGSVYAFVRTGTNWMQEQQLLAADGEANDQFGNSLALSGDTLVAGATGNDVGGVFDQGSAYVFVRNRPGSLWLQQRHLFPDAESGRAQPAAPNGVEAGVEFGFAVAISGDTILAGAPNDDGAFRHQGAAYVFVIGANNYSQQQPLVANDGAASDFFGGTVAISGDTAVIGAHGDDVEASQNQGSAYVFVRSGAGWSLQKKLTAEDGAANDAFGTPAISGDTIVIGASEKNNNRGAAYVFVRNGTNWTQQQKLIGADRDTPILNFGNAVAISGDTIVIGAPGTTVKQMGQGAVFVFTRSGTIWSQHQILTANDSAANDNFGASVTISGNTLAVGAIGDDFGAIQQQGSAYIFIRNGITWMQQQKLIANDGTEGDGFGSSVSISGDTVAVGASSDDIGANVDQGSAYVFVRNSTTQPVWVQQQKLTANDGAASDRFGGDLALSGDTIVVGALGDDIGANLNQGSAYVFTRSVKTWMQAQKLTAQGGAAGDQFATSVALSGNTILAGATTALVGNVRQGSSYVFVGSACPAIALDPATLPDARPGVPYNQTLVGAGGTGPYQFSLSEGALPPGLTLSPTGQLSGTPTTPGMYRFTITATILSSLCPGSRSYTLTVSSLPCPDLAISPSSFPVGQSGVTYGQPVAASGGAEPYSFTVSAGALPTGLTLFSLPGGGMLTGTPTVTGNFSFTILATDANGCQGTRSYTLTIIPPCPAITINPASLPNGTVGVAYSQTLTATGGASPYTFTVSTGNLPAGLSLSGSGALTGTPTVAGSFNCVVRATDANGCQGTRTYPMTINGNAAGLQFYPLAHPVRLLDTRIGQVGCDAPGAKISGGTSRTQTAAGRTCDGLTIPVNAAALVGNATSVQSGGGFFTLYPSDIPKPNSANSNFAANQILNSLFTVRLGGNDGAFKIFVSTDTDIVVDITGYYAPPSQTGLYFHPLPKPVRLLDTRPGASACFAPGAPLQANTDTSQISTTTCDGVLIPAGALALTGNATTVSPQANGFLTLYPSNAQRPLIASANFQPGVNLNSPFMVGLSPSGQFNLYVASTTDLVVDVTGYYSTQLNDSNGQGLLFSALTGPSRLLDTRAAHPGCFTPNEPMTGGTPYTQPATGACSTVPAAAKAMVGNATAINATGNGYLTFWPSDTAQPFIATSNYRTGITFNRHFTVGLGADGAFNRYAASTTDLIVDLVGFFAP